MSADIKLQHETVQQATDEMVQATRTMVSNLQELVDRLQPFAASFQGQSAQAWSEFQQAVNQATDQMNADFGQGATRLQQMHETIRNADRTGAQQF